MSLDLSYLDKMSGGDLSTKKQMLEVMQQEITQDLPRLEQLYEARDWEEMERFCHHFKSTVVFSGNKALVNANQKLWDMTRSRKGPDAERAAQLIRTIKSQGQRVNREVAGLIKKMK